MTQPPDHSRKPSRENPLPVGSDPAPVPTFGCVIYLRDEPGAVHGRVANLAGIEATGGDQRAVMGNLVAQFKQACASALENGGSPDWIDPPDPKRDGERKVFLPVHL